MKIYIELSSNMYDIEWLTEHCCKKNCECYTCYEASRDARVASLYGSFRRRYYVANDAWIYASQGK